MSIPPRCSVQFDPDTITVDLFTRWYRLRKSHPGLVPALIQEGSHVWTYWSSEDPWGSRERLSLDELRVIVEAAELELRKCAGSERGESRKEQCA